MVFSFKENMMPEKGGRCSYSLESPAVFRLINKAVVVAICSMFVGVLRQCVWKRPIPSPLSHKLRQQKLLLLHQEKERGMRKHFIEFVVEF
jgi:hypothetical protein